MKRHVLHRRAFVALGAVAVIGVSGWGQAETASIMSCFTVAGKMSCIETAHAPAAGFMPPVIVPTGAGDNGKDHHIVIQDDGGRKVARG